MTLGYKHLSIHMAVTLSPPSPSRNQSNKLPPQAPDQTADTDSGVTMPVTHGRFSNRHYVSPVVVCRVSLEDTLWSSHTFNNKL